MDDADTLILLSTQASNQVAPGAMALPNYKTLHQTFQVNQAFDI